MRVRGVRLQKRKEGGQDESEERGAGAARSGAGVITLSQRGKETADD